MTSVTVVTMPENEVEGFAFQHSSPLSLRQPSTFSSPPAPPDLSTLDEDEFSSADRPVERAIRPSESITHHHGPSGPRRSSGHSSISSFPASVLHHDPQRTPSHSIAPERHDMFAKATSPRRQRGLASAFRNPSSIIDMQLNDDTGDDTESVVSHHRRSGSRMSVRSHGSNHSSPCKRGSRSLQSSPKKSSGLRKEFPLVLLHCTLLQPSGKLLAPTCDNDLFAALLPDGYRQRWIQLQDKLSSAELKSRGILLPHPQEDYELLEERLLEALELETPRIQGAHFDDKGVDSGFESGSQTGSDSDDRCPDCGKQVDKVERNWEIKVFAANGLMRGAAWSAAWRDMEKVDVEIGLFMPEDVRREVNTRLEALHAAEEEARMQEAAATSMHADLEVNELPREDEVHESMPSQHYEPRSAAMPEVRAQPVSERRPSPIDQFFQDRRNIVIILLSITVAVYAFLTSRAGATSSLVAPTQQIDTTVVTSTAVWTTTVTTHEPLQSSASPVASVLSNHLPPQKHDPAGPETALVQAEARTENPSGQEDPAASVAAKEEELDTSSNTSAEGSEAAIPTLNPEGYEAAPAPTEHGDAMGTEEEIVVVQDSSDESKL